MNKNYQKQSAFTWQGQQYTFVLFPGATLIHNLIHGNLDYFDIPQNTILPGANGQEIQIL